MGRYTKSIGHTILIRFSSPDDRNVVDEWLAREDDSSLEIGYISPDVFYIRVNGHHNPRRVASQIGSELAHGYKVI